MKQRHCSAKQCLFSMLKTPSTENHTKVHAIYNMKKANVLWKFRLNLRVALTNLKGKGRKCLPNRPYIYFNFFQGRHRHHVEVGILSSFPRWYLLNKVTMVISGKTLVVNHNYIFPRKTCLLMQKACCTGPVHRISLVIVRSFEGQTSLITILQE